MVGRQLVEQPLVVGDEHDAHLRPVGADLADALGDDAQRVDVEAGVGLVEDRQSGSRMASCMISLRFFSPPEKPSLR